MKNKSKLLNVIFRILVMLTFISGMLYIIRFVSLANAPAVMTSDEYLSACRSWTYYFFVYLIMTAACTVLSVLTVIKGGNKLSGAVRTAVLLFAAVSDVLSLKYVTLFRGYEDAVEAARAVDSLGDKGKLFIIMSFIGAMLLFFLVISSVYSLAVSKKHDELDEALGKKHEPQDKQQG